MLDLKMKVQEEKALGKNPAINYKLDTFNEIDGELFNKRTTPKKLLKFRKDAKKLLQEHEALVLRYITGRIKLYLNPHEFNMDLNNTLLAFYDARNWEIARFISELIISKSTNPVAYRVLGDVEHEEGNDEKMWELYEKYALSDAKDRDVIIKVGMHVLESGDVKKATELLERGLLRQVLPEDSARAVSVFSTLIDKCKSDFQFLDRYVVESMDDDAKCSASCGNLLVGKLEEMHKALKAEGKTSEEIKTLSDIIDVLGLVLTATPQDQGAREKLIAVLKERYASSPRLSECLRKYDIRRAENVQSALAMFQKEISYAKGSFFIHKRTGKVGLISDISKDGVFIKYTGNETPTKLSLQVAFETIEPITKQHIKAIKKGVPPQKIKEKVYAEGGIQWLTRTLLYSLSTPHGTMLKDMKLEMVPQILSESEWKSLSDKIKNELKTNPYVRVLPGATERYMLSPYPMTEEEKQLSYFNATTDFDEKLNCFIRSIKNSEVDKTADSTVNMMGYFAEIVNKAKESPYQIIASSLALDMTGDESDMNIEIDRNFEDVYSAYEENTLVDAFKKLPNTDMKKAFVDKVSEIEEDPEDILESLVPHYPSYVPQKLKKLGDGSAYYAYLKKVFDFPRQSIDEFLYFMDAISPSELEKIGFDQKKLAKSELTALSYVSKMDENVEKRKRMQTLKKSLIDGKKAEKYIAISADEDKDDLKTVILYNDGLDTEEKNALRDKLYSKWPDLVPSKKNDEVKVQKVLSGFLCLSSSYDKKQAELKEIQSVDMPNILKEINTARELGDLRENSEYQYAKEHKRELERRIGELNSDLNTVRIVKKEDVLPDMIGFGTKVTLKDNTDGSECTYTFLGRWESEPEKGIIDFNAPLGKALQNHKVGEDVKFTINGKNYDYTVQSIEVII